MNLRAKYACFLLQSRRRNPMSGLLTNQLCAAELCGQRYWSVTVILNFLIIFLKRFFPNRSICRYLDANTEDSIQTESAPSSVFVCLECGRAVLCVGHVQWKCIYTQCYCKHTGCFKMIDPPLHRSLETSERFTFCTKNEANAFQNTDLKGKCTKKFIIVIIFGAKFARLSN